MVSYVDVLRGDPAVLASLKDRKVIIGGTAIELGDRFNVPEGRTISGPMLQTLAAESILQGRNLRTTSPYVTLGGLGFIVLLMAVLWRQVSASLRIAILAGLAFAIELGALLLQAKLPIILDTSFYHAAIATYFAAMALDEIDFRSWLGSIAEKRFHRIAMSLGDGFGMRRPERPDHGLESAPWRFLVSDQRHDRAAARRDLPWWPMVKTSALRFRSLICRNKELQVPGGKVMELEAAARMAVFPLKPVSRDGGTDGFNMAPYCAT
jgi:hypothetical protein